MHNFLPTDWKSIVAIDTIAIDKEAIENRAWLLLATLSVLIQLHSVNNWCAELTLRMLKHVLLALQICIASTASTIVVVHELVEDILVDCIMIVVVDLAWSHRWQLL